MVKLVLIAGALVCCLVPSGLRSEVVHPGQIAPDFTLRDLDKRIVRLSDHVDPAAETTLPSKKTVLLDFFRTDCAPCKKELPAIIRYFEKNKDHVVVLMIALLEPEDGEAKLRKFLGSTPVPFPVVLDPYEVAAGKYITERDGMTLPCIISIDGYGKVVRRIEGLTEELENLLDR